MSPSPYNMTLKQAALHLKLPPFVVLKCVKRCARPNGGMKLPREDRNGSTFFKKSDLDKFIDDLSKPWVDDPKAKRPPIPSYFEEALRLEASFHCALCGKPEATEFAHIRSWPECLHHHPWNLVCLCPSCHTGYDVEHRIEIAEVLRAKQRVQLALLEHLESFGTGHNLLDRLKAIKVPINGVKATGIDVLLSTIGPHPGILQLRKCRLVEVLRMLGNGQMSADPELVFSRLVDGFVCHLSMARISQISSWDHFLTMVNNYGLFPEVLFHLTESGEELLQSLYDQADKYVETSRYREMEDVSGSRLIEAVRSRCQEVSDRIDSRERMEILEMSDFGY